MAMQDPGPIEHAGAKEMRIRGWAERMSFLNLLPVHTAFCPGELNSFADLTSRIADKLQEAVTRRAEESKRVEKLTVQHTAVDVAHSRLRY